MHSVVYVSLTKLCFVELEVKSRHEKLIKVTKYIQKEFMPHR